MSKSNFEPKFEILRGKRFRNLLRTSPSIYFQILISSITVKLSKGDLSVLPHPKNFFIVLKLIFSSCKIIFLLFLIHLLVKKKMKSLEKPSEYSPLKPSEYSPEKPSEYSEKTPDFSPKKSPDSSSKKPPELSPATSKNDPKSIKEIFQKLALELKCSVCSKMIPTAKMRNHLSFECRVASDDEDCLILEEIQASASREPSKKRRRSENCKKIQEISEIPKILKEKSIEISKISEKSSEIDSEIQIEVPKIPEKNSNEISPVYYLKFFKEALRTAIEEFPNFCEIEDKKMLENFENFPEIAQKLFVRIFLRKHGWISAEKLQLAYSEIPASEVASNLQKLAETGEFLLTSCDSQSNPQSNSQLNSQSEFRRNSQSNFQMSSQANSQPESQSNSQTSFQSESQSNSQTNSQLEFNELESVLKFLSVAQLRILGKSFHLGKLILASKKEDIVAALLQHSKQQTPIFGSSIGIDAAILKQ